MESEEQKTESVQEETSKPTQLPIAPASGGNKLITTVLTILVCVQLVTIALLYFAAGGFQELHEETPTGSFALAERSAASSASVRFGQMSKDPEPTKLAIRLENESMTISYSFPEDDESEVMIPSEYHLAVPQISYYDSDENKRVNSGDELSISGLESQTDYAIRLLWASTGETLDTANLFVPGPDIYVPPSISGSFVLVQTIDTDIAVATFGNFGQDTEPTRIKIILGKEPFSGTYNFPTNDNGTVLAIESGIDIATLTYLDHADNQIIDPGDQLWIEELEQDDHYTIIMIDGYTGRLMDVEFFSTTSTDTPVGQFANVAVNSNTEAVATFAKISTFPEPMKFRIFLRVNSTIWGTYEWTSNDDGTVLTLVSGDDVGTFTYRDLAENQKVNSGDELRMTGLAPSSDFTLKLIWKANGDQIHSIDFTTP